MLETRWGECNICKQVRLLYSVVGKNSRTGNIWAGWICSDCLDKQREKDWGKELADKLFKPEVRDDD